MNDANPATDAADLVEQLGHPQTRRAARQKLVAARAVGPLLECLDSRNESVVWAAVQSLGELRAKEAVEPLVGLLDRGTLVFDVCEALLQITGSNFGTNVKRWRESLESAADPAKLDVAECVARTADYLGVKPTGSGTSYQFQLPLPEGRSQKVAVYFGRQDTEGHELVVIYSECGPANPKLLRSRAPQEPLDSRRRVCDPRHRRPAELRYGRHDDGRVGQPRRPGPEDRRHGHAQPTASRCRSRRKIDGKR